MQNISKNTIEEKMNELNTEQLEVIEEAYNAGLTDEDILIIAKKEYAPKQMLSLLDAIMYNKIFQDKQIDITLLENPNYDHLQISLLKDILVYNINNKMKSIEFEEVANDKYNIEQMTIIAKGLMYNVRHPYLQIQVGVYEDEKYDAKSMDTIYKALVYNSEHIKDHKKQIFISTILDSKNGDEMSEKLKNAIMEKNPTFYDETR